MHTTSKQHRSRLYQLKSEFYISQFASSKNWFPNMSFGIIRLLARTATDCLSCIKKSRVLKGLKTFFDHIVMVVNKFYVSFRILISIVLVMPGKPSFGRLEFNIALWYRNSLFSEETSRCQPIINTPRRRF